jgi:hypothetical protein
MVSGALMSSAKDTWGTPRIVRSAVDEFAKAMDREVIDPCPGDTPVGTGMASQDGLRCAWNVPKTIVFCNPPYGRSVRFWVQKANSEAALGTEVLMLLASRTDTRWFHDAMRVARSILFIEGRLTFLGASDPAPFPSVVLYYGTAPTTFAQCFAHLGTVVER